MKREDSNACEGAHEVKFILVETTPCNMQAVETTK